MPMTRALLALMAATCLTAEGAIAHHSTVVNFDPSRQVTIVGVLTEATWRNPHSRFRLDVTYGGVTQEWLVEMGASNTLKRAGFPMDAFTVGDRITVTGSPGYRDRSLLLREAVLADGRRLQP